VIGPGAAEEEVTATVVVADFVEVITVVLSCGSGWVVWPCTVFAEA
jgi:hypothetical protein